MLWPLFVQFICCLSHYKVTLRAYDNKKEGNKKSINKTEVKQNNKINNENTKSMHQYDNPKNICTRALVVCSLSYRPRQTAVIKACLMGAARNPLK